MIAWSPRAAAVPMQMPRAVRCHPHVTGWECRCLDTQHPLMGKLTCVQELAVEVVKEDAKQRGTQVAPLPRSNLGFANPPGLESQAKLGRAARQWQTAFWSLCHANTAWYGQHLGTMYMNGGKLRATKNRMPFISQCLIPQSAAVQMPLA